MYQVLRNYTRMFCYVLDCLGARTMGEAGQGLKSLAGPFRIVEVLGCYNCHLSDGQKWNSWCLKHFLPNLVEWTKFSAAVPVQPQEVEDAGD